ncbi:MAG: hypothetical protein EOO96_00295 [Pedobacter sp.]|nr:MAG: hypothetical protein EOO96_00295 [Pedobacter sp.]
MKFITILLVWMLANLGLHAQTKIITITGETTGKQSRYVYLRSKNEVYFSKIVGNRFEFILPKTNGYELATLFFLSDSLSKEKVCQMFENGIDDSRTIAIENLHILAGEVTKEAVVRGGEYNFQLDDMFLSLKKKTYLDFFNKYSDSPVSLTLLRLLISMSKISPYLKGQLTLKVYFDKLSNDLKESEEGKKLWAMIAPMYKI